MCQRRCFTGCPPQGPNSYTQMVPVLQVRSASSRGRKHPTRGHIACEWQSDSEPWSDPPSLPASPFLACPIGFQPMDGTPPCPALWVSPFRPLCPSEGTLVSTLRVHPRRTWPTYFQANDNLDPISPTQKVGQPALAPGPQCAVDPFHGKGHSPNGRSTLSWAKTLGRLMGNLFPVHGLLWVLRSGSPGASVSA